MYVDRVVVNAGASDRKAISISGWDVEKMTDCYFNMAGNPLERCRNIPQSDIYKLYNTRRQSVPSDQ